MKQTDQYGLNQWEPTDRILMEDFNADNLKIAAALAGKMGRFEAIYSDASERPTGSISTNPMVHNWNDWELYCYFFHVEIDPAELNNTIQLRFRCPIGETHENEIVARLPPASLLILLFPWHDENRMVEGLVIGGGTKVFKLPFTFKNLISIDFIPVTHSFTIYQKHETARFGVR